MSEKPVLKKTWPERFSDHGVLDKLLGIPSVPSWPKLEQEREACLDREPFRSIPEIQQRWNIHRPHDFLILDSVFKYVNAMATMIDAHPELNYYSSYNMRKHSNGILAAEPATMPIERLQESEMYSIYALRRWEHFGKKIFVLDPQTFGLLCRTDLPRMPASSLKFAYQSFYLMFPEGMWEFDIGPGKNKESNKQPIEGIMVNVVPADDFKGAEVTIMVCGRSSHNVGDDNLIYLHFALDHKALPEFTHHPVSSVLAIGAEEVGSTIPHALFNFLLYLMSEQPRLEPVPPAPIIETAVMHNPAKIRKAETRNARQSRLGFLWVGPRPQRQRVLSDHTPEKKWQLDHTVWVRGHWKEQPFGPGRMDRKLIWIEPYVKGLDVLADAPVNKKRVQRARAVIP